jgi:hexosaminidase
MKKSVIVLITLVMTGIFYQCTRKASVEDRSNNLIPVPMKIENWAGTFTVVPETKIMYAAANDELKSLALYLAELMQPSTGFDIEVIQKDGVKRSKQNITLLLDDEFLLNDEGYSLSVDSKSVLITAGTPAGLFYGIQTLRQLLPVNIEMKEEVENVDWVLPCVEIRDEPRFPYRGLHLDVGRHFFPVSFIKKYIDLMALHKMNYFHWHLTEDQGWRIEIKKYPKLTEVAAFRNETLIGHAREKPEKYDGERYGGFYTQEEIKEIVEYARKQHITIIPEIEMPGHSQAVLAAYPELGCTGGPYEVVKKWGVMKEVFCAGNDNTFEFLESVLLEVMELFPGEYIHIGGDECPKDRWEECEKCQARMKEEELADEHELQSYFIKRIEEFLLQHDRKLIGWDEILEGGLAPEATVMSWRGTKGGIAAAKEHHDVIMTPTSHCYLDYYQGDKETEPLAIGGFLPLNTVYSYEPVPEELTGHEVDHILGTQGNVWTEYMKTTDHVEYMVYPRACALAETGWTPKELKDFENFFERMEGHYKRLTALDVNARKPGDK